MYQTLDDLWRGRVHPEDIQALGVVMCDDKFRSLNNRRLADLKMLHSSKQQETVCVRLAQFALQAIVNSNRPRAHRQMAWHYACAAMRRTSRKLRFI